VRLEGIGKLGNIHLIGARSRELLVCCLVPQPLQFYMAVSFQELGFMFFPKVYSTATNYIIYACAIYTGAVAV
jgi:hypothetical protein